MKACKKHSMTTMVAKSARQAFWVACQPSVLTVLGAYAGHLTISFCSKTVIRLGERSFTGAQRQGRSQHAIAADRRRNVAFLAVELNVFFIGQQMLRQLVRIFNRRTNDLKSPETSRHPVPIAVISSKHTGQRPKGHAKPA